MYNPYIVKQFIFNYEVDENFAPKSNYMSLKFFDKFGLNN